MAKDIEGRDVFLADSGYVLSMAQQDFEHIIKYLWDNRSFINTAK